MVSQFPSPRILDTATPQPIAFSCDRFFTYNTNENFFDELKAQRVSTIFSQNKLCNAWPFRFNYSFFLSNFLILILILFLIFFYGIPLCIRTKVRARSMDDRSAHILVDHGPFFLSFFLNWIFLTVVASRWLGVYECYQPYSYRYLSTKGKTVE